MALSVVQTNQEGLLCAPVLRALHAGVEAEGQVVLMVPSFPQALAAQKELAQEAGLALAVTTTTPSAWVKERWEVWGDGRTIADGLALEVLVRQAFTEATPDELGSLRLSEGLASILASLVGQSLPWLPLKEDGSCDVAACKKAGLTDAETQLMGMVGVSSRLMRQEGLVSGAEASLAVVRASGEAGVRMPPMVVAGFSRMGRRDRELMGALGRIAQITVIIGVCDSPASQEGRELAAALADAPLTDSAGETLPRRHERLDALRRALFTNEPLSPRADDPVELLLAAGPLAEAELVAQRVQDLVGEADDNEGGVAITVTDMARAYRDLVPKLAGRGLGVRFRWSRPLLSCPAAQAFFSFAQMVARLSELAETWPEPVEGYDGLLVQLGDMSWWPPRELSDFLLSDISQVDSSRAWWSDALWRGNRLLTPARMLEVLQSEKETSPQVARATMELLRGRIGTAASRLLAPFVDMAVPRDAVATDEDEPDEADEKAARRLDDKEARAALQAILQIAGSLRELGVTADPAAEGAVSLSDLIEMAQWAAESMSVTIRGDVGDGSTRGRVHLMTRGEAAALEPGSVDALVVCGMTTAESPIRASDDLHAALLEQVGVETKADHMARARNEFYGLISVPRQRLVLERTLYDSDSKLAYPSVMLSELMAAYGIAPGAGPDEIGLPVMTRPETVLGENLSPLGQRPRNLAIDEPALAGKLGDRSRGLIFVPQEGSAHLPGGKPLLSASQIETYLDCPYKWFSLRRLRLGTVDAGHSGMEMGTFAHRVLEVTHRQLLLRALEQLEPGVAPDDLLAAIEADPVRRVPDSRVSDQTIEVARDLLSHEFELHRQHMYMVRRPRQAQQLLVAHDSQDRAMEEQLLADLVSSLSYQARILEGFEPRLFEWSFGRHGDLVEYAGAYITGTVDRIDVSPHGTAVIIDYKHKSPTGFTAEYDALQEGVVEGLRLPNRVQSLVYAQVVRRAFADRLRLVGTVYLSTKSPHALAGCADENLVDQVFGRVSTKRLPLASVPRGPEGESGMNDLLDRTEELVAHEVEQMRAGNIEARPRDRHSCDFCPVMACERRVMR